jgi:hypothetical protein
VLLLPHVGHVAEPAAPPLHGDDRRAWRDRRGLGTRGINTRTRWCGVGTNCTVAGRSAFATRFLSETVTIAAFRSSLAGAGVVSRFGAPFRMIAGPVRSRRRWWGRAKNERQPREPQAELARPAADGTGRTPLWGANPK